MTKNLEKGRVSTVHRTHYDVLYDNTIIRCEMSGRFHYIASASDYPIVGDYVLFRKVDEGLAIIESVMERENTLHRLSAGTNARTQYIAANIDYAFVCMSVNKDFNIRKLQNFLNISYSNSYETIILLTKTDLIEEEQFFIEQISSLQLNNEIIFVSSVTGKNMDYLEEKLKGKTSVFIGSSGVGKSSLINTLLDESHFEVNTIRETDAQGRHTTTHRELLKLNDGYVIDTPGIRTIHTSQTAEIDTHFEDVLSLANMCEFRNCSHKHEPGCKVIEAIENNELSEERLKAYKKVIKLDAYMRRRESAKNRKAKKGRS